MTLNSRDYAALADDAYIDRHVGKRQPGQEEKIYLNGHQYKVREHVSDSRTGYQGTVYQRTDSGEIIVAHRGTEQLFKDAILTDGTMVIARTNLQADQAIALTRRATEDARVLGDDAGRTLDVSVTGHSLGGTLTQITGHHFGLKGETFNAHGAVSLTGYRIPEGGSSMINHVMAADPVSAASPHYGEVRIYATPKEIENLSSAHYSNSRLNFLAPDFPFGAAVASLDSHKLKHFLGPVSVLSNDQALRLADRNERMIAEYRDDIDGRRTALTVLARGLPGGLIDAHHKSQGPLEPGEPARQATEQQKREPSAARMDDPTHPAHALFKDAQRGVHEQDARLGRTPDVCSDQLAGSLACQMHAAGGKRIDAVLMSPDAANTFAVQGKVDDPAHLRVTVATLEAINTPLDQSSRTFEANAASQARELADRQLNESLTSSRAQST